MKENDKKCPENGKNMSSRANDVQLTPFAVACAKHLIMIMTGGGEARMGEFGAKGAGPRRSRVADAFLNKRTSISRSRKAEVHVSTVYNYLFSLSSVGSIKNTRY